MASPHSLALTKKVYSILKISDAQQKQQAKRSDTETRAMENQFAYFIATRLALKFVYCETRLGAIYASIKGDRREILHSVVERLGFLKAQGQNPSEVDLSNAMLQHGISSLSISHKPPDQLDSLEIIVNMAHELIDMRTIHDEPYSSGNSYSFGDHLIQKFSAAVYLSREPLMTLIEFIKQNIISQNNKLTIRVEDEHEVKVGKDCSEVLTYVFGLAKSGLNGSLSDALPSIIQFMCQTIVTTEPIVDDRIALVILACLRQAQDFTLCRKVHHEYFKRQIFSYKFLFLDLTRFSLLPVLYYFRTAIMDNILQ
ncbi:PREDICTED: uncharacterized protein LOC109589167 isoform X2 [Amphimedon queenslandica]|nr:PREDICTED: uncharacterized protein LOC109589167 isoform X2 [Amphimedon queenslandica]|eukprot:XP_019860850.1 PREDICTED: uncharacterized protein LOC109589167 isoform X2 [Amphimedon queenslandica]